MYTSVIIAPGTYLFKQYPGNLFAWMDDLKIANGYRLMGFG